MNEVAIALFENLGVSVPTFDDLLKSIDEEKHLKNLVPSSFFKTIYSPGNSLYDLMSFDLEELYSFPGFGASKESYYLEFKNRILNNPEIVTEYYLREIALIILPIEYHPHETIETALRKIMIDFAAVYRFRGKHVLAEILEWYFGIGKERTYETFEIGERFDLSNERVRQLIRTPEGSAVGQLFTATDSSWDRFQANPDLVNRIQILKENSEFNERIFDYLSNGNPISDLNYLERLVEFFGGKISKYRNKVFLTNQEFPNLLFEKHFMAIERVLKNSDKELTLEEIEREANADLKKDFILNSLLLERILKTNPLFFEISLSEKNLPLFQVPWKDLASQNLQVRRILLEKNEKLSREEILKFYNRRCTEAGLPPILNEELHLSGKDHIVSYGNNTWGYGDSQENRLTCQQFIDQYLRNCGGAAHFDTVKNVLLENNYIYPDSSIRSYLSQISRISLEDTQFFIHQEYIHQFSHIRLRAKMNKFLSQQIFDRVFEIIKEHKAISKSEITRKIIQWSKSQGLTGNVRASCDHLLRKLVTKNLIQLEGDLYSFENEEIHGMGKIILSKEPAYRILIRSLVIDYLKSTNNSPVTLKKLKEKFDSYLPENLKIQNFYKIFRDEKLFEKTLLNGKTHVCLREEFLPEARMVNEEVETPLEFEENLATELPVHGRIQERDLFDFSRFDKQIRLELSQMDMNEQLIQTGLSRFYEALKLNGEFSRWGLSLLQPIYDLWFGRTDYYDREVCIIKLTHGYETFIKKLDNSLMGSEGLGTSIRANRILSDLYEYNQIARQLPNHAIDYQKRKFSKHLKSLVFYRNLYTHDNENENLEMGLHNQILFASQFLALYIYTGAVIQM